MGFLHSPVQLDWVGREVTSSDDIKYGSLIGAMGKTSQGKWDRACWGVEVEGYRFS